MKIKILIITVFFLIFTGSAFASDMQTIKVSGMGTSEKSATDRALLNALDQVKGAFVAHKEKSENGQLVQSSETTLNVGYIQDYKVVETRNENGAFLVSIEAYVPRETTYKTPEFWDTQIRDIEKINAIQEKLKKANDLLDMMVGDPDSFFHQAYHVEKAGLKVTDVTANYVDGIVALQISRNESFWKNYWKLIGLFQKNSSDLKQGYWGSYAFNEGGTSDPYFYRKPKSKNIMTGAPNYYSSLRISPLNNALRLNQSLSGHLAKALKVQMKLQDYPLGHFSVDKNALFIGDPKVLNIGYDGKLQDFIHFAIPNFQNYISSKYLAQSEGAGAIYVGHFENEKDSFENENALFDGFLPNQKKIEKNREVRPIESLSWISDNALVSTKPTNIALFEFRVKSSQRAQNLYQSDIEFNTQWDHSLTY